MSMRQVDIAIIGGGAAGIAAALGAHEAGAQSILILEREAQLGGILKQCIHNGFGLHRFKEELTGPEYAARDICAIEQIIAEKGGIEALLDTMVLDIDAQGFANTAARESSHTEKLADTAPHDHSAVHHITAVNAAEGLISIEAGAVILAMGSRERTRGALNIAGARPAGIYTAGTAQALVNLKGQIPGREVVMLGSGDIGLIMARRLVYEGVQVKMVLNRSSFSGGLKRNIVQCLDDYDIPLIFNRTITAIHGKDRLCGVTVSHVDPATKQAIAGTEEYVECDTLLLAAGLLPENELTREAGIALDKGTGGAVVDESFMTKTAGIFSAGNVLHIHDLVDYVSEEGELAGRCAAYYLQAVTRSLDSAAAATCEVRLAADDHAGLNLADTKESVGQSDTAQAATSLQADAAAAQMDACIVVPGTGVGSVVPQLITPRATGKLALRFRVKAVTEDAYIVALADGVKLAHAKRRIMVPAEMETLTIKADELIGKKKLEVVIEKGVHDGPAGY